MEKTTTSKTLYHCPTLQIFEGKDVLMQSYTVFAGDAWALESLFDTPWDGGIKL